MPPLIQNGMLKLRREAGVYSGQVRVGTIYKTSGNEWFWASTDGHGPWGRIRSPIGGTIGASRGARPLFGIGAVAHVAIMLRGFDRTECRSVFLL
jgi:hypothetical protein